MDINTIKIFSPEIFLSFCILIGLVFNSQVVASTQHNFPLFDKESFAQTLFIVFLTFCLVLNNQIEDFTASSLFCVDLISQNVKLIVLFSFFCSIILGQSYFYQNKVNLFEFFVISLLALFSLMLLSSAQDLVTIYISLEMQSLCLYILAAFNRESVFSTEAGLKYFILGAFASGLYLFGASVLYGLTGTTNLPAYALLFSADTGHSILSSSLLYLGMLLILITFLFKIAAAPFHVWSPDVYEGAPFNSTVIFVLVPKVVMLLLIFRVFYFSFFSFFSNFQVLLVISGTLSVIIGSLLALRQKRLKRLLVYSSISHVGYILLGCSTGTLFGLTTVLYYIIFYVITSICVWGSFMLFQSSGEKSFYISELAGLSKKNPVLALSFSLALFSLAGVPPLVGFSMKYFLFSAAISAHLYGIASVILVLSVLGAFYYMRLIKITYFETFFAWGTSPNRVSLLGEDLSRSLIAFSLFFILLSFVEPTAFLLFSHKTILGLYPM